MRLCCLCIVIFFDYANHTLNEVVHAWCVSIGTQVEQSGLVTVSWYKELFDVESFVSKPSIRALWSLKRTELIQVAEQYNLTVTSGMKNGEVIQLIASHLHDKELVSEDEGDLPVIMQRRLRS